MSRAAFTAPAGARALAHARAHLGPAATVEPLTGDASERRYFRARGEGGPVVLAVHAAPFDPATLNTIDATRLFAGAGLPVPALLGVDAARGVLRLEDLGDTRLQDALAGAPPPRRLAWYREAVALIHGIQRASRQAVAHGHQAGRLAFDAGKLGFEMGFFLEHYVEGMRRKALPPALAARLRADLARLVAWLAARPRVLSHRDFHARNLMVRPEGSLALIDHQDARMGPVTYDLASLVYDPYVDLAPAEVAACLEAFVAGAADPALARRALEEELAPTALQRLLKAVGTYGYQTHVRGTPVYRPYIGPALARARAAAQQAGGFPATVEAVALLGGM